MQPDGPRNGAFVGTRVRPAKPVPYVQLEGRVALIRADQDLGGASDFYLGHRYARIDGVDVFNWRNPLGRSFFESGSPNDLSSNVAAVRTFDHHEKLIVDYFDDVHCSEPPQPLFGRPTVAAPISPGHATAVEHPQQPAIVSPIDLKGETTGKPSARAKLDHSTPSEPPIAEGESRTYVRAESLLRSRLRAPRKERLSQVLATLQPEQYRLITAPASDSVIIEGGPGTGKTIIASHRAAYFIHDDPHTASTCDGDVILIGPTPEYCSHVSDVIRELTDDSPRVKVVALAQLNDLPRQRKDKVPSGFDHVSPEFGSRSSQLPNSLRGKRTSIPILVHAARVHLTAGLDILLTVETVYEYIRGNGSAGRPLTQEFAWRNYLRTLPSYTHARSDRSLSWLLELIEHDLGPFAAPNAADRVVENPSDVVSTIRHVIVDEAQDLTASDWLTLRAINHGGGWTIIGDLNQRRADNTFRHWTSVLKAVGLPDSTHCNTLERGYRSTIPILEFADRLLPRNMSRPIALQADGPAPRIVKTIREYLAGTVVQEIDRLVSQHPAGTIAVIATTPGLINARLQREPKRPKVKVLGVNQARGLEFDAVIVVEPSDFPHNDRRQGPLYTALTRPNRELVVVHTIALPLELHVGPRAAVRPTATSQPRRAVPPRRQSKVSKPKRRRLPKSGK